jgi:hypothetical protein
MNNFPHLNGMKIGSQVVFGRPNGEKTRGEVVKINRKSVKVRQTEVRYGNGRTRNVGQIWNVHPNCLQLEGGKNPQPTPTRKTSPTNTFNHVKGDKVRFRGQNGEILEGFVKRVNAKTVSVEPHKGSYSYWRVPFSLFV